MKVLLLGSTGQLGWELQRTCPDNITLITCDYPKIDYCNTRSIRQCIHSSKPECIINAAAYTAVDKAEQQRELAYRINHEAVKEIADLCNQKKIVLVHISTDFVFKGEKFKPYDPEDIPDPQSVYGKSKLEGELAVKKIVGEKALIIRTAWLYSTHGNNFVKTMLNLMREEAALNVVDDQIGTPTWAYGLGIAIWVAVVKNLKGIFHWTDAGVASWYDFAVAIQEEGMATGIINSKIPVFPVSSSKYATPAKRPFYGVLNKESIWKNTGIKPLHWRTQLRLMISEL